MGSAVVEDLANSGVEEVTIGDLNKAAGDQVVSRSKSEETTVSFERVDVNDPKSVKNALANCDIAVNTIGPFFKYEKTVINYALEESKDYVDICDDHDATNEVFKRKEQIDSGSSRVVVGMGWTPGITNVLARAGYEEVPNARDIDIAWSGSAADASGKAVISHVFHAVTGEVPVFIDGKLEEVPARQMRKETIFPPPINKIETYVVGHPEPITIPLFLKGIKNVVLRGALLPVWQNHLVSQFADVGLTEETKVNVDGVQISSREFLASFVHQTMSQFKSGGVGVSGFYVNVSGESGGKRLSVTYSGADKMRSLTGWSASIGAQFLSAHKEITPGLYAPEGVIAPKHFFNELARRKIMVHKRKTEEE